MDCNKEVPVLRLTTDAFEPFGRFILSEESTEGSKLGGGDLTFYPDRATVSFPDVSVGFGLCVAGHRGWLVTHSEFHTYTPEVLIPLGDVVIHVGPPTREDEPPKDQIKAFFVPAGTVVILKEGVWHHGPHAIREGELVKIWVMLPPRVYHDDCEEVPLGEASLQMVQRTGEVGAWTDD